LAEELSETVRIEAVVTCVDYGDFLAATIESTKRTFDHLVVVTSPDDEESQRVCRFHNVQCLATDAFRQGGDFCKGKGINAGLATLRKTDWLCHLDADIVLPPRTREMLERAELDPRYLYGIDRTMCRSWEEWSRFVSRPEAQHEHEVFVHPGPFPTGVRIWKPELGGYLPLGYFQLWNVASGQTSYPEEHRDAARGDMLFASRWPRARRQLIPEVFAWHLESAPALMGINWSGRKSPRFGPNPVSERVVGVTVPEPNWTVPISSTPLEPMASDNNPPNPSPQPPSPGPAPASVTPSPTPAPSANSAAAALAAISTLFHFSLTNVTGLIGTTASVVFSRGFLGALAVVAGLSAAGKLPNPFAPPAPAPAPSPGPAPVPKPTPSPVPDPMPPPVAESDVTKATKAFVAGQASAYRATQAKLRAGTITRVQIAADLAAQKMPLAQKVADAINAAADPVAALEDVAKVFEGVKLP
jgi:hypothetical protein